MKKILLLVMGTMLAFPSFAQEGEDVTHLIANPGFDEDLTFQVDGSMKEIVSTNSSLSDRSWAYIAVDSSVYAKPKTTSGQSRPDGRKLEATNGFPAASAIILGQPKKSFNALRAEASKEKGYFTAYEKDNYSGNNWKYNMTNLSNNDSNCSCMLR